MQVADVLFPAFGIPVPRSRARLGVVAGFPVALVFGWLFEISPDGFAACLPTSEVPIRRVRSRARTTSSSRCSASSRSG
jgi:hypothetical protein